MEVIKPSWIKHHDDKNRRQCIFSADVDLENVRLATGGMDGTILVWRLECLFDSAMMSGNSGKLLASMNRHNGSVLCVRWSSQGQLASSSDDTIILIWQLDSRPIAARGNLEGLNDEGQVEENYKIVKRLIGHQSDTVAVEWSPDGKLLASCSLDGTICFWNTDPSSSQTLLAKLEHAHKGFVKGLAWDPSGKLLASQSDDGSCIIWNIENLLSSQSAPMTIDCNIDRDGEMFKETVLDNMFLNMSKMTFFHRPSWSPDGSILALPNASNKHIPVVALIERNDWHGPGTFLVGHLGPVEAVRFNPRLFTREDGVKEMICALAGQDGQVSIWSSTRTEPLVVLQDLFEHTVMDITWSRDGSILIAVSYDGTAVAIRFNSEELNIKPMSSGEQVEFLRGSLGSQASGNTNDKGGAYLENVKVIEQLQANENLLAKTNMEDICNTNTPVSISVPSAPAAPVTVVPVQESTESKLPVKAVEMTAPMITSTTLSGKKRITPQLVTVEGSMTAGNSSMIQGTASQGQDTRGFRGMATTSTRLRDEDFLIHRKLLDRAGTHLLSQTQSSGVTSRCVLVSSNRDQDTIRSNLSMSLVANTNVLFSLSIEVTNYDFVSNDSTSTSTRKSPSASIQFVQNSQISWKERVRGSIYMMTGNIKYSIYAIQSADASRHHLLIFTASGRRHFPLLSLDSKAVYLHLDATCHYLHVLTTQGTIYIWDLLHSKILFNDSSIGQAIPKWPVSVINLTSYPNLLLTTTSSSLEEDQLLNFIKIQYNPTLCQWTRTDQQQSNLQRLSSIKSVLDPKIRVEELKTQIFSSQLTADDPKQLSELEFELALIFVNLRNGTHLQSETESSHFERVLAIYALKLAKESKTWKARELLDELKALGFEDLGKTLLIPIFCHSNQTSLWQDFISNYY